ncbi:MAG: urease accessory protein UreE [Burkholderiales bacterium]|jgi:urease accessory protein
MLKLENIVGAANDPSIADKLHELEHRGRVEYLTLSQEDTHRHRLRAATDSGTECAVILDRSAHLYNGAVLMLDDERAVVVRMRETEWLTLAPRDTAAALEIGYFSGNMHWAVKFDGDLLRIALQGPVQRYIERIEHFLADGRVIRVGHV